MQRKNNTETSFNLKNKNNLKIGIVVSSYNNDVTYPMRDASLETLIENGVKKQNLFVYEAPGAFEIPFMCQKMIKEKKIYGIIAIGCVIKGDTDHYHFIAEHSTRGVMDVMLKTGVPISNAILTVNNLEQAQIRSKGSMNKGIEAAEALLKTLS